MKSYIKVGKQFKHNVNGHEFIIVAVKKLKTLSGEALLIHMINVADNNQEIYCTDEYLNEYFYLTR